MQPREQRFGAHDVRSARTALYTTQPTGMTACTIDAMQSAIAHAGRLPHSRTTSQWSSAAPSARFLPGRVSGRGMPSHRVRQTEKRLFSFTVRSALRASPAFPCTAARVDGFGCGSGSGWHAKQPHRPEEPSRAERGPRIVVVGECESEPIRRLPGRAAPPHGTAWPTFHVRGEPRLCPSPFVLRSHPLHDFPLLVGFRLGEF